MEKAPYPWFGGKARIAPVIWQALGDCLNYVEPFFGGGATLLQRPNYNELKHTETINDLDCNVANFWRCLQSDPEQLAAWADWPVSEADLHARHQWLVNRTWGASSEFKEAMMSDPDHCDFKQAGWWVWGICQWIGSGWCDRKQATVPVVSGADDLGNNGMGVHRQLPHLGNNGMGVHRKRLHGDAVDSEANQDGRAPSAPALGGQREGASAYLYNYFEALAQRTRRLRICCGDFERVLGPTPTHRLGITGVLLDPPYDLSMRENLYSVETEVSVRARQWAMDNGDNPRLRIILCGYEGEHSMPDGWRVLQWKANGGYGSQGRGRGRDNASLERLWLSPHCLPVEGEEPCNMSAAARQAWALSMRSQLTIFDALGATP